MLHKHLKKFKENQVLKTRNDKLYFSNLSTTFSKKRKTPYNNSQAYKPYKTYKAYKTQKKLTKYQKYQAYKLTRIIENFLKQKTYQKLYFNFRQTLKKPEVKSVMDKQVKEKVAVPTLNFLRGKSTNYFRYYMYRRKRFAFKRYSFSFRKIILNFGKMDYLQKYKRLTLALDYLTTRQSKLYFRIVNNYKVYRNTLIEKKYMTLINKMYILKKYSHQLNRYGYMEHIKYTRSKYTYFNFRRYKSFFKYFRRKKKWLHAKRYKRAKRLKVYKSTKNLFKLKRRFPYRLRRVVKSYKYKYFTYYWLRYFFNRFSKMCMAQKKNSLTYPVMKKYLFTWLKRVASSKYLAKPFLNPARGFLLYKNKQRYSRYKQLCLFNYRYVVYFEDRNVVDVMLKDVIRRNQYRYKSLYWRYYKSVLERKKLQILNKSYRFVWSFRPYMFVQKKYKMFYNWGDRHLFKRFPLYRYKYTLCFKFPRYADYRRLFKNQLREQHLFRYLYRLKLSQLIKHFRKATYKTKRIFELMFLKHFELRLDTVIYRLNFAWSLKHARQLLLRGLFLVNNKVINSYKYHVNMGDVIMPIKRLRTQPLSKKYVNYIDYGNSLSWLRLFYRQIQMDQYPSHFLLNERIPAGMIINNVNPFKVRYHKPFSLQFLTLSLLKYS